MQDDLAIQKAAVGSGPGAVAAELSAVGGSGMEPPLLRVSCTPTYVHACLSCSPQGMAFTLEERLQLGIHGLIPPCFLSQDVQLLRVMRYYERQQSDLDK